MLYCIPDAFICQLFPEAVDDEYRVIYAESCKYDQAEERHGPVEVPETKQTEQPLCDGEGCNICDEYGSDHRNRQDQRPEYYSKYDEQCSDKDRDDTRVVVR